MKRDLYAQVFAPDSSALMPTIDQRNITNLIFFSDKSKIYKILGFWSHFSHEK